MGGRIPQDLEGLAFLFTCFVLRKNPFIQSFISTFIVDRAYSIPHIIIIIIVIALIKTTIFIRKKTKKRRRGLVFHWIEILKVESMKAEGWTDKEKEVEKKEEIFSGPLPICNLHLHSFPPPKSLISSLLVHKLLQQSPDSWKSWFLALPTPTN